MAASTSLYRKYRSSTFEELVGQEPVVRTLKNAIASGRIAHAYLFTGPRGVGKTSAARLLARAANCLSDTGERPCNKCENCLATGKDIVTDLIEIDAASNTGVDNIREIIERANFAPSIWRTKFYIIDEVHMLSVSAFNALLKTLEEPPPQTAFILATTEVHKVPATVASRCQRFDFRKIPLSAMTARLRHVCDEEGIVAEQAALELVARQSTGSLRDALSLLDQLRVYAEEGITLKSVQDMLGTSGAAQVADFVDMMLAGDLAGGMQKINSLLDEGLDARQFNRQIVEHLRNLMLVKSGAAATDGGLLDATEEMRSRLNGQAAKAGMQDLLRWVKEFAEADSAIRSSAYRQLPLEMALVSALLPPDAEARPQPRDRGPELPIAADQVGSPPPPRPAPSRQVPPAPAEPQLPPPIHRELGSLSTNGSGNGSSPQAETNGEGKAAAQGPSEQPPSLNKPDEDIPLESSAEPEPQEDAATMEAPHAGGDEVERLIKLWPRLCDQITARSRNVGVVFSNPALVRVFAVRGNKVIISFRDPIQRNRSQYEPARTIIEESLTRVLGYKCILESILFSEEETGGPPTEPFSPEMRGKPSQEKKVAPHETTRGRAAMNIFGIKEFND
ncbi:MAG: polymerase subunit gamma/tau [Chloroflexia bacterium]|jgi:DNA polymerase-3 subunit gamma/tau|nr:polymerase subunit gamma/tau [Chloroflexia bacterium]